MMAEQEIADMVLSDPDVWARLMSPEMAADIPPTDEKPVRVSWPSSRLQLGSGQRHSRRYLPPNTT